MLRTVPRRSRSRPREPEDRACLHALFDEHADVVFRYAASRCGRAAAEDLVAETFAEAVRARARFDVARGTPRAWLLGIATNRIRRLRRDEDRHLAQLSSGVGLDDGRLADLPDRVDAQALAPVLAQALADLPASERRRSSCTPSASSRQARSPSRSPSRPKRRACACTVPARGSAPR
jgi:RNA polymerase sigma-70 factor (ECF subfamily)